jgi:hypothetical protein
MGVGTQFGDAPIRGNGTPDRAITGRRRRKDLWATEYLSNADPLRPRFHSRHLRAKSKKSTMKGRSNPAIVARRQSWPFLRRRRDAIGATLAASTMLAVVLYVPVALLTGPSPWLAFAVGAIWGGMNVAGLAFLLDADGVWRWWKGALGESKLQQDLAEHRPDLRLYPGLRLTGEVDLVAVGSTGVYLFESKLRTTAIDLKRSDPTVHRAVRQAAEGARRLGLLLKHTGIEGVTPIVYLMDFRRHARDHVVIDGAHIVFASESAWWNRLPGTVLSGEQVEAVLEILDKLAEDQSSVRA